MYLLMFALCRADLPNLADPSGSLCSWAIGKAACERGGVVMNGRHTKDAGLFGLHLESESSVTKF